MSVHVLKLKTGCPICGSQDSEHDMQDFHGLHLSSADGEPLAFVVDTQKVYGFGAAARLSAVRAELKKYYENKEFDFIPYRYILKQEETSEFVYGGAFVTAYIVLEK